MGRNWVRSGVTNKEQPFFFQPGNCMQCDEPSCVAACPVPGATFKASDGRILIDPLKCINCGTCVTACPYNARFRHPDKMIADKCDFCQGRLKSGLEPACVVTCPTRARVFGDLNDPESGVSKLVKKGGLERIVNPVVDTEPNVFYVKGSGPLNWPVVPTLPGGVHMSLQFWKIKS
jgi:tetrathionate reductase subunit B